jgi:hypothetical protein
MTRKIYRTAQGKQIDLGALLLQNEHVRAVGNMNVNARGDLLDSQNKPIDTRNNQLAKQYKKQVTNVNDDTVYTSKQNQSAQSPAVEIPTPPEDFEDNIDKAALDSIDTPAVATGLAGAIARARQVKQEPLKTARQIAQMNNLKKI